ncbi:MAG: hypothetical protein HC844_16040 [Tabrizicola sp.]|nr:hypothetical protein [Tabrizicola sp.]
MVWGMPMPMTFGDFFPDGEFVDRRQKLIEHFNQMPEAEKAKYDTGEPYDNRASNYVAFVSAKFSLEIGFPYGGRFVHGRIPIAPLELHEWPTDFRSDKGYKALGALINANGYPAVTEPMRDLLERLEPEVHRFNPFQITMPRGAKYPETYFLVQIGRFLDAFLPEKSDVGAWRQDEKFLDYSPAYENAKYFSGLAVSGAVTAGAHLWRDRRLSPNDMFISDELHEAARAAGLRLPKHYKMKTV